ncbi:MAG: tyrosine--tRNA ligase [Candidatus Hydrogenedentes bacterium]|nr:tyrosine--tRNA ligase [Candidatus Hydrogenedentota bacterium]
MTLFEELSWRGYVTQITDNELPSLLEKERFTLYSGFDPTADSFHIGSLLPIMGLMRFQRAGHKPIALLGGATGLIGDPSFKAAERPLLTKDRAQANVAGQRKQLERFIDFTGPNAAALVNNADWLCSLTLVDFLRDIGKHFSVNVMLAKDSVKVRLNDRDHGISFTEFTYSLLQAYDFLHLYDTHGCRLQIGGSDQWGNIVAGMDLTRRLRDGASTFGLTMPLITKADGSKFGKSETGNVWLSAEYTSPYKFYQFWINQADAETPRFLKLFTFLGQEEIGALECEVTERPEKRSAQRRLAEEVTRMVHGEDALRNAIRASQALFGGELAGLDDATLEDVFSEAPSSELPRATLGAGRSLAEVLVECGVFASKGEVKRLVQSGGLYINNERVESDAAPLTEKALTTERIAVVRKGKKSYHVLKFVTS